MSRFSVSIESLRAGGADMERLGDELGAQLDAFDAQQQGFGAPWGTGTIGSLLGPAYLEVSEYVLNCLFTAADELARSGTDLGDMAAAYETADADAESSMAGYQTLLG